MLFFIFLKWQPLLIVLNYERKCSFEQFSVYIFITKTDCLKNIFNFLGINQQEFLYLHEYLKKNVFPLYSCIQQLQF